ncbi:MAG: zinc-binding dehydrogenase, partial [Dehalococcoidia bacterium]|nr:zinc-binding dehydrogenase [Dehalococcoidia bacterium]
CVKGDDPACPMAPLAVVSPAADWPHFTGTYAEYYYLRPNHTVFKVPDVLSDRVVAPANCALSTVLYGFERANLSFGDSVVIQGAGGLGIYAAALAKDMGAHKVIVVDGIDERLQLAREFGADEVIDIREYQTPAERFLRAKELTGGWGADVVAELVGSPHVIDEGIDMLANGGRYLEIGNAVVPSAFQSDISKLVVNNKSIIGVLLYTPDTLRKALDFLVRTRNRYPFDKILSHSYPLEDINKAFEEQNKGHVCRSSLIP